MKVTYGAHLPMSCEAAFELISRPENWPRFIRGIATVNNEGFDQVGGRATTTARFLGREVSSGYELTEWDPPHAFRYNLVHEGRPTLDQIRVFTPEGGGTAFVGTSEGIPRVGLAGLFDRFQLMMLKRMMTTSMKRLAALTSGATGTNSAVKG